VWLAVPCFAQTSADLFDDSVLQEIRLDVRPSDWNELKKNYTENTYYASDMRWLYKGNWIGVPQVAIRSRGQGSRSPVKPSLLLDFDRYNSTRQFLGLKSIVMRNNTQDPSMLHERMSFELMRQMGINAPRAAHARLYVNDEYMGLYMIVESVDEAFVRGRFNEDGFLYNYEYPWEQDTYRFQYRGPSADDYCPVPFNPETHTSAPQCEEIERMVRTMNEAPDEQFERSIAEYVDLRAFLKEIAVEAYLADGDGMVGDFGLNNFFLYRYSNSNRFAFIPWDKSNTFGLADRWIWLNTDRNVLSRRAFADPTLRDVFIEAITAAASTAGGPGGWIEQEIARAYAQIREAALEDPNKQCPDAAGLIQLCSNDEFENGVALMISFARARNAAVADQIRPYSIPDRGGISFVSGPADTVQTGYARIHTDDNNTGVSGFAIFGFRQDNVLVGEAAVPATGLVTQGRLYAEINSPGTTGLAIANPNAEPATLNFYFTDPAGNDFGQGSVTIPVGGQLARFLNEEPYNAETAFRGSFTFTSSMPVSTIALLGFTNERGIFLTTTLPVIDLLSNETPPSILPLFVDGGGWSTDLILVNPYDEPLSGRAEVVAGPSFDYSIAARASVRIPMSGHEGTGWIRLITAGRFPVASGMYSYESAGVKTTQTALPAIAGDSAFRLYAEALKGSVQSGIAIANLSANPVAVSFELTSLSGESTGLTGTITIPGYGHVAKFLNEIPWTQVLPDDFRGLLRVSAGSGSISVTALRGRYNEAGNFLITSTPAISESAPPPQGDLYFPHWVNSPSYTTQFVLYSFLPGQRALGRLEYLSQWGEILDLSPQE
jgi:spore coat protein CotH